LAAFLFYHQYGDKKLPENVKYNKIKYHNLSLTK
jgi:hypothetical protein